MKIAIVGPIPRDTITTSKGVVIQKYGGITNPVIALSKLVGEGDEIIPVVNLRKQDREPVEEIFSEYHHINFSGINDEKDMGAVVNLRFLDENKRVETQTACMNPILPKHVAPFVDVDVFIFVPITDYEISLSTLQFLSKNSNATIIFDAHGPTNCMSIDGKRHLKFWIDRDEWLPYIDILKMNLEESRCCWFQKEYLEKELQQMEEVEEENFLDDFGKHVIQNGVQHLLVTLDSRGCVIYSKDNGSIQKQFAKPITVEQVIDTTGCGDSFAGGLGYGMATSNDILTAANYANALGALRTQGKTFDVFKNLKKVKAIIEKGHV